LTSKVFCASASLWLVEWDQDCCRRKI